MLRSKLAHMLSLSSSRGQEEASEVLEPSERLMGLGLGLGLGFGFGFGFEFEFGPGHGPRAETSGKKRRFSVRKRGDIFGNHNPQLVNYL